MARMAVADGIGTVIVTPHQLGSHSANDGDLVRGLTAELERRLAAQEILLRVLPGADVRIEPELADRVAAGSVLSLGDHRRHVLLELPHELYLPMEPVIDELHAARLVPVLSHPERNQGLLRQPRLLSPLVDRGCLMQITASSLVGVFGPACQQLAEWMIRQRLTHFIATDAHGAKTRRPLLRRAVERASQLAGQDYAFQLACHNPSAVAEGRDLPRDLLCRSFS